MGLTSGSTGRRALDGDGALKREAGERIVALAGNPNVGKSTLFNELTGLNQHTGNWPGKTVSSAQGTYEYRGERYRVVDLPGTYSLFAHSAEEEVARDFLSFGGADVAVVVCDATCLERNLNLVLQTLEITDRVVVCLNLMDEAEKKKIKIDQAALSEELSVPVIGCSARSRRGIDRVQRSIRELCESRVRKLPLRVRYDPRIERALAEIERALPERKESVPSSRFFALKLLEGELSEIPGQKAGSTLEKTVQTAWETLREEGLSEEAVHDEIVRGIVREAERISARTVQFDRENYCRRDRQIDRILTSRVTGIPLMLLLLALVFYLTIWGANVPSELLSDLFGSLEGPLLSFCEWVRMPRFLTELLVFGIYRVMTSVVAVMLPPMAIFFPLFTLLEDVGYLPRVAFNLDRYFKKCNTCGKQALTTCMGFGCNAAGIVGCRIIDSPRERLIAMITNSFVPCNGRFPHPHKWQLFAQK